MQFDLPEDLNQNSRGEVIPFGKYKGQPIEVLAHDDQYRDWLMTQDWFRSRFPQLVQIVVNNFGQPSETPEHNQMQARFLELDWQLKFSAYVRSAGGRDAGDSVVHPLDCFTKEEHYILAQLENRKRGVEWGRERGKRVDDRIASDMMKFVGSPVVHSQPEFEAGRKSIDVEMRMHSLEVFASVGRYCEVGIWFEWGKLNDFRIEIKPSIGDDYPAVIRQMRDKLCHTLLYRNYSGSGVDEETFRRLFKSQGFLAVRESDVESTPAATIVTLTSEMIAEFKKGL